LTDCVNVYSRIAYPRVGDGQITIEDLSSLDGKALIDLVFEKLRKAGKLISESDRLNPEELVKLLQRKGTMRVEDVYELFCKDRTKPFILSGKTIIKAVEDGVTRGDFGYAKNLEERDGKYLAIIERSPHEIDWDGWLVEIQLVYTEPITLRPPTQGEGTTTIIGRHATLMEEVKPLSVVTFEVRTLKESLNRLGEIRAFSPGKKFNIEVKLEIRGEGDKFKMVLEYGDSNAISSDVERLLNSIDRAGKYTVYGYIKVTSDNEGFVKELEELKERVR